MSKLSVLVITKNEEKNIEACLESVGWADEIVVIDAESTDATVAIAQKYTDKVYINPWQGYSNQKNFGASKCSHEWILSLDADERTPPELGQEIRQAIGQEGPVAYRIRIKDYMFGRWIEHTGQDDGNHIRVYRTDSARWEANIHEKVQVVGPVGYLSNRILHFSHLTIYRFIEKANRYTEAEARNRFDQGVRKSLWLAVPASFRTFIYYYIERPGYKDGGHGFVRALLLAVYHLMIKLKLWELWYKHDHQIE